MGQVRFFGGPALWIAALEMGLCGISAAQWINAKSYPVPTAYAQLNSIASGPDGALWFTEWCCDKIGRLTTAGNVTEYPLPPVPNSNCGQPGVVQCGPS